MSATAAAAAAEDDCGAIPEAWGEGRLLPLPLTAGVGVACGNDFFIFPIAGSSDEDIDIVSVERAILWVRKLLRPEPKRLFGEFLLRRFEMNANYEPNGSKHYYFGKKYPVVENIRYCAKEIKNF